MLVLSRKINQSIHIGPNIRIIVSKIQDGQVRLCIEAPVDIPVHRQEVLERIGKTHEQYNP